MKYEVKWRFGRFLPYGNIDPNLSLREIALDYISKPNHGDRYAFPAIERGARGRAGAVKVAIFDREAVFKAVLRFADGEKLPALGVHNGGIAIVKAEMMAIRQTFGKPVELYETDLTKAADLKPDYSCINAPYARAWEKVCARAAGGRHVGGLRNLQIDFITDDE